MIVDVVIDIFCFIQELAANLNEGYFAEERSSLSFWSTFSA
jgi:hypothetical protein